MFSKAHRILFVIICNGWYSKDIIQTGVTDYVDQQNKGSNTDYSNGVDDFNPELRELHTNVNGNQAIESSRYRPSGRNSIRRKLPRSNQKTNFSGFRNQQVSTMTINPAQQINEISSQGRERPFFPPRAVEGKLQSVYITTHISV